MARPSIYATCSWRDQGFLAGAKRAAAAVEGLGKNLNDNIAKLEPFKEKIKSAGSEVIALGSVIGAAAGAVGGMALKIGTEFDKASNSIAASTGVSQDQLSGLQDVMKDIYANNYGENFEDIASAISTVTQNSRRIDPANIKELTTNALALRDTFGYDIQESIRAANMLTDQFGISGTEAFNLIAQGAQIGLDKNGDLLDTINEYSVHFNQIGIDAEGMFNALLNGAASGTFSVDKLGDAVKEFGIRIKDGTGDEALTALGLSAEKLKQDFVAGGESGRKAFETITDALFSVEDRVEQNQLGVQLFGSMWEDLGSEGVQALTDINGEFNKTYDTMNQIKEIKYDDLGSALEGLKRTLETNLLLPFAEQLTPTVADFVDRLRELSEDGTLQRWGQQAADIASSVLNGIGDAIGFVAEHWNVIEPILMGIGAAFLAIKGINIVSGIAGIVGAMGGIIPVISAIMGPIGWIPLAIGGVVAGIGLLWKNCEGFRNFVTGAWEGIKTAGSAALDALKTTVSEKLNNIKAAYEEHGGGITGVMAAAWTGIKEYCKFGYDYIDNLTGGKLTAIKDKFLSIWESVKNGVANIWNGIVNSVKGAINNVISAVNGMMSKAAGGINKLINGINNISSKVGIPEIPTITAPKISLLADGGILTKATMFGFSGNSALIGGEAGAEAVLPLNKFWSQLERFIGRNERPGGTITNHIYVTVHGGRNEDDDTLANKVARRIVETLENM